MSPVHLGVMSDDPFIIHELVRASGDPLLNGDGTNPTPFQLAIDLKRDSVLDYFLHMKLFLVDC